MDCKYISKQITCLIEKVTLCISVRYRNHAGIGIIDLITDLVSSTGYLYMIDLYMIYLLTLNKNNYDMNRQYH